MTRYSLEKSELSWQDGSPYSPQYQDIYFSHGEEDKAAQYIFIDQNNLLSRWQEKKTHFSIGELGFGTGLNFFVTFKNWIENSKKTDWLHYVSFEKHPLNPSDIRKVLNTWPHLSEYVDTFLEKYPEPIIGTHRLSFPEHKVTCTLVYGDVTKTLKNYHGHIDAWYLDGFTPKNNESMWSKETIKLIAHHSKCNTTFATYTAAGNVRRSLEDNGFSVEKYNGFKQKRESLKGIYKKKNTQDENAYPKTATLIGGGLAGACLAEALSRRGIHVTIIEKNQDVGQGASGNSAAILQPYLTLKPTIASRFYLEGFLYALQFYPQELLYKTGIVHFPTTGRLQELLSLLDQTGLPQNIAHRIDKNSILKDFGLNTEHNAFHYPKGAWIRPHQILEFLLLSSKNNIQTIKNTEITRIEKKDSNWNVYSKENNLISTSDIVICTNAYDALKIEQLKWLPLQSVRGQIIRVKQNIEKIDLDNIICYDGYIIDTKDDHLTLGTSYDHNNFNTAPSADDTNEILQKLQKWCPKLTPKDVIEERVSFRTSTYDRFPFVGRVPDVISMIKNKKDHYLGGLYLSIGFGSRGFISCPLAAEKLTAEICDEPIPIEKDLNKALEPMRFVKRCIKRCESKKLLQQ